MKKAIKKATEWLKKAGYLETNDLETIDYNNDVSLHDVQTVVYNNDTQLDELHSEPEQIVPKNISTLKTAKKITKKYRNLKRKGQLVNYSKLNKKSKDDDIVFIKQVPVHPRDRFKKLAAAKEKVELIKQVPVHPRDRLKRAARQQKEVEFIKQVPLHPKERLKRMDKKLKHPRDRMKNKELQIAKDNFSALMIGKFSFDPKKILNKILLFDTKKIDENIIMDRIIEALPPTNDKFFIEHPVGR